MQPGLMIYFGLLALPVAALCAVLPVYFGNAWGTSAIVAGLVSLAFAMVSSDVSKRKDGKIDLFAPSTLMAAFVCSFFALPALMVAHLNDYASIWGRWSGANPENTNFALLVCVLGLAAFWIGLRLVPGESKQRESVEPASLSTYMIVAACLITVGLVATIYHLSTLSSSPIDLLARLSPSERHDEARSVSQGVVVLESALPGGVLLLFYGVLAHWRVVQQKTTVACVLGVIVIVAAALAYFTTAKRSSVLPLFLLPLIWIHYTRRPFSIGWGLILFLVGAITSTALLAGRILVPLAAKGIASPWEYFGNGFTEWLRFYYESTEFAAVELLAVVAAERADILDALGGPSAGLVTYNLSAFLAIVPRVMWPDKPELVDVSHALYSWVTHGYEPVGYAVTVYGTSYLFGGLAGTVATLGALGFLSQKLYRALTVDQAGHGGLFFYGILFWLLFQAFRFGTVGFTFVFFLQTQLSAVVGFLAVRALTALGKDDQQIDATRH